MRVEDDTMPENVDDGEFPPDGAERNERAAGAERNERAAGAESAESPDDQGPAVGVAHVPSATAPTTGLAGGTGADAREQDAIRDAAAAREAAVARDAGDAGAPEATADADAAGEAGEAPDAGEAGEAGQVGELEPEELAPGEVPVTAAALWEDESVDGYRDRWQQIQLRFIDDPRHAAEQAQDLVGDVCRGLADALDRHRRELDGWQGARLDDTEELRMSVRRYRDLLDRLLSL